MQPASLVQATSPHTPFPALLALAEDHPAAVATNPSLSQQPHRLAKAELFAAVALASCPEAPEVVLRQLALDPRSSVRATVAQNPSLTPSLVGLLAFDDEDEVRATALQHRHGAGLAGMLSELAGVSRAGVRGWFSQPRDWSVQNPTTHPALLRHWGREGGVTLARVLANPGCPEALARELLEGWCAGRSGVLALAQKEGLLQTCGTTSWSDPVLARRMLRHLPPEPSLLVGLFSRSLKIRKGVYTGSPEGQILALVDVAFSHPALSPAVLRLMSTHALALVRIEALRHPLFPAKLIPRMLGDRCYSVRRVAWFHKQLPEPWRERLRRLGFEPGLREQPAKPGAPDAGDLAALARCGPWLSALARAHGAPCREPAERLRPAA